MDGQDTFNGFQFDHDSAGDEEIHPVPAPDTNSLGCDGDPDLSFKGDPAKRQFMNQTLFVGGFQEPWAQFTMHFKSEPCNLPRKII